MCEKLSRCEKVCKSLFISEWRSQGEPKYVVPNDLPHTGTGARDMEEQMMFIKVEIAGFFSQLLTQSVQILLIFYLPMIGFIL